jgi:hypothetical protein
VGVDDFYSGRNTAFTGFNAFFGAGSEKWRRRFFHSHFFKIAGLKSGDGAN